MGRVLTNNVGLAYTINTAPGVTGTSWFQVEPNTINQYGANITTVARRPISQNRQARKGVPTDLDSSVEIETDLTLSEFRNFVEGFVFSTGKNNDVVQLAATGAETTGDTYTGLTALTAAQAAKFIVSTLIFVTGGNSTNNGLKVLDTGASASDTTLAVAENLSDETASFRVSFAGYRVPAATALTWAYDSNTARATLSATGLATTLQALGLTAGGLIHLGSVTAVGGALQNGLDNGGTDTHGYARVHSFSGTDDIILDKLATDLQDNTLTDGGDLDLVFGEFIRNVPVSDADYIEREFEFEAAFPNLGDGTVGNTDEAYQYALRNLCSTLGFAVPLTNKATVTYSFIGTDTQPPTTTRKTGASSAALPTQTAAFSTSADVARIRVQGADESGLTTDFLSLNLSLNNNAVAEKVIGTLGAKNISVDLFEVSLEGQVQFSNPLVVDAIRNNTTVSMDFIFTNDDGIIGVDIPSMTLGGGGLEFPVGQTVPLNLTGSAFGDATFNTSIGISIFHVPLPNPNV